MNLIMRKIAEALGIEPRVEPHIEQHIEKAERKHDELKGDLERIERRADRLYWLVHEMKDPPNGV